MRLRFRLAAAATAVTFVALGLTGVTPANASAVGYTLANYLPGPLDKYGNPQGMCLSGSSVASTNATIQVCDGSAQYGQLWHVVGAPDASGFSQIANHYNLCLGVAGGSNAEGAHVTVSACRTGHLDQYWAPYTDNVCDRGLIADYYPLVNEGSFMALNVHNGSMTIGNYLTIWPYAFRCNNQNWGGVGDSAPAPLAPMHIDGIKGAIGP